MRKLLSKATFSTLKTTETEVLKAVTVMISLLEYNAMVVRLSFINISDTSTGFFFYSEDGSRFV
jgi:hypothetical protein